MGVWVASRMVAAGGTVYSEAQKLAAVISLISKEYVEAPDLSKLSEGAIEGMLKRLDPHSNYISAQEQAKFSERDVGEFEGIGISFVIQNELIQVISPITGTPAERLGIRSGDRIVEIDGVSAYGITNEEVFKKLRGPRGTRVNVQILRAGLSEPLDFTIVRDKIPIHSVAASFMLDDSTGYVMLTQFMATTTTELEAAFADLGRSGMTRLIFDLRNNEGGRLTEAVSVADMFIPGGHTLVSRAGRNEAADTVYKSTDATTQTLFNLIVLINEGSASASEIVAGAVQDLDRGLIVGQNSFGKGLVQYPYRLKDGAVIRLSTAHWFTPSGRLVQRPYDKGRGEYYAVRYRDHDERDETGELDEYYTISGRVVYSSSGIAPDVLVEDRKITAAAVRLLSTGTLFEFAQKFVVDHKLNAGMELTTFRRDFKLAAAEIGALSDFANADSVVYPAQAHEKDIEYLSNQIKAEIAQLLWNDRNYYYLIRADGDPVIRRARALFDRAGEIASVWRRSGKG